MARIAKFILPTLLFFGLIRSGYANNEDPKFLGAATHAAKERLAGIQAEIQSMPEHYGPVFNGKPNSVFRKSAFHPWLKTIGDCPQLPRQLKK